MVKRLRFSRIQLVEGKGALMLVSFLDDDGNMYNWAPKWADVDQIFIKQTNVERFNKPESEWLNRFAKTAQQVVEGAQRIQSGYKVQGEFTEYREEKLIVYPEAESWGPERPSPVEITPGFEVTISFLDNWLDRWVEALVVNDIVIRLRTLHQPVAEYPEPEDVPFPEPEDLPFD